MQRICIFITRSKLLLLFMKEMQNLFLLTKHLLGNDLISIMSYAGVKNKKTPQSYLQDTSKKSILMDYDSGKTNILNKAKIVKTELKLP